MSPTAAMAAFFAEIRVVEIKPAVQCRNVKGGGYRVKLKRGARHPGTVWHNRTVNERPQHFRTFRMIVCRKAAAQGIEKTKMRGIARQSAICGKAEHVIGNLLQDSIRCRPGVMHGFC